jgi:hypothetical protein
MLLVMSESARVRIVSPVGIEAPPDPIQLAAPLGELAGKRLALLSNAKHNVDLLLFGVAERLGAEGAEITHRRKPTAVAGAGLLIRELSARAHGVVTGMGD